MQSTNTVVAPSLAAKTVLVVLSAALLELCLGTFYAWGVFKNPLIAAHGWSNEQATLPLSLCAFFTGLATFLVGARADRSPRNVALMGGTLFGIGVMVAGFAALQGHLMLLYLSFGVTAGLGVGLGYITGIAVPLKWLPHRKGLVSGIVIMSFGAGAMIVSTLGPRLFNKVDAGIVLLGLGAIALMLCIPFSLFLTNPPGFKPRAATTGIGSLIPKDVLSQWAFWALWLMVFLNVYAGFAIISQGSQMFQSLFEVTRERAGTLMGIVLICNGIGRIFWSTLSDKIGCRNVLVTIFVTLIIVFASLIHLPNVYLFAAGCAYILLCYGGLFSTMPAFTAEIFGVNQMGRVYGPVLTAISAGGLTGPMVYSYLIGHTDGYAIPLYIISGMLVIAAILPLTIRKGLAVDAVVPTSAGAAKMPKTA